MPNKEENEETSVPECDEKLTRRKNTKRKHLMKLTPDNKIIINYNDYGLPVGESITKLRSYIGLVVMDNVSILYNDWRHVLEYHVVPFLSESLSSTLHTTIDHQHPRERRAKAIPSGYCCGMIVISSFPKSHSSSSYIRLNLGLFNLGKTTIDEDKNDEKVP
ncbi:hypothetical protein AB3S75_000462 [Citrus x aurantiifolia]